MMFGGDQQETLNPIRLLLVTNQQAVPVFLRELMLFDGFDLGTHSFNRYYAHW